MGAPDWHPTGQAEAEAFAKQASQTGGHLVDASVYAGGGGATLMTTPAKRSVDKKLVDSLVAGFIHGVTNTGAKIMNEESATLGKLKGKVITFQGQSHGQMFALLAYVVFTDREVYLVSLYGKTGTTKTDPFVTNYLSRIRIDPIVVPGDVDKPADGWDFSNDDTWFRLGLIFGVVVSVSVILALKKRRRKKVLPLADSQQS